jgi:KaiC/GvpD/RAD55 family RecA-like ATPase
MADDTNPIKEGNRTSDYERDLDGLLMGFPLDHLLEQSIEINKPYRRQPGIKLPTEEGPGTGNIVIHGPPGIGKSTLGLQMAVACAKTEENRAVSAFISLESTIDEIMAKARDFGWASKSGSQDREGERVDYLLEVRHLSEADDFFTPERHAENLLAILTRPENCPVESNVAPESDSAVNPCGLGHKRIVEPLVLLPMLTPRDITDVDEKADSVFWRRYRQLEHLLLSADKLEELRQIDLPAARSRAAQAFVSLASELIQAIRWHPVEGGGKNQPPLPAAAVVSGPSGAVIPPVGIPHRVDGEKVTDEFSKNDRGRIQQYAATIITAAGVLTTCLEAAGAYGEKADREMAKRYFQMARNSKNLLEEAYPVAEKRKSWLASLRKLVRDIDKSMEWEKKGRLVEETKRKLRRLYKTHGGADVLESELEKVADAIAKKHEARAILPLVVIDSLNTFGAAPLDRNQINQLFRLFKRYRRIGVFIVETSDETPFDSTIADVVIRLSATKDNGYAVRHIEIEKSRYTSNVRGLHPFKSIRYEGLSTPCFPMRNPPRRGAERKEPARCGIVIFPSLHHVVLKTDSSQNPSTEMDEKLTHEAFADCFGIDNFDAVLPRSIYRSQEVLKQVGGREQSFLRGNVLMIEGDRGTFKTSIAMNFLAQGLICDTPESVMLIRLSDVPLIEERKHEGWIQQWPILSSQIGSKFNWQMLNYDMDENDWQNIAPVGKVLIRKFSCVNRKKPKAAPPSLFELDFKGGYILPEEFVQFVCDVLIRRDERDPEKSIAKIHRVVLSDVSQIGVSYPLLRNSITSGDIFLPTFVHLMRNYGVNLVMVGTKSGVPEADAAVNKAATLADSVISCRYVDVFGQRHVLVGGGKAAGVGYESKLPIIRRVKEQPSRTDGREGDGNGKDAEAKYWFELDKDYLEGLVGLETANPHRPGLILHVFEENQRIHSTYNREMGVMLRAGLSRPERRGADSDGGKESGELDVLVQPFDSHLSEAIHDSLDVLKDRPVNRTVLCTVDEFSWKTEESDGEDAAKEKGKEQKQFCEITNVRQNRDDPGTSNLIINDLLYPPEVPIYVWPYFCNVLLIAYKNGRIPKTRKSSPRWPPDNWRDIRNIVDGKGSGGGAGLSFWFDRSARETLSCMLMDALISANDGSSLRAIDKSTPESWIEGIRRLVRRGLTEKSVLAGSTAQQLKSPMLCLMKILRIQNGKKSMPPLWSDEHKELIALMRLLRKGHNAALVKARERLNMEKPGKEFADSEVEDFVRSGSLTLPSDADILVCWYSQLRELVDWNPELAEDLRVCPLPGGGFRGDWYIGILKGSVSEDLGREAIDRLCRLEEDYKRFARGVGLPVRRSFSEPKNEYFAWPIAIDPYDRRKFVKIPVTDVFGIHKRAWSRSDIPEYIKLRSTLSVMAEQLCHLGGEKDTDNAFGKFVDLVVGDRLFYQLKMLRSV